MRWYLMLFLLAAGTKLTAQAQEGEFGAKAAVRAPIAATNPEDATASGTAIDVRARRRALEHVGEALAEVPGTRVQYTGAFGSFAQIALRGTGSGHTTVLLGDIPLTSPELGVFDLSLIPLPVLESVEVYRGGAPVWWSDGAIGGVVRLLPREARERRVGAMLGAGSFGRLELHTTSSVVSESAARPAFFSHVSLARADNDYTYVDDGGTRFDTQTMKADADDVVLRLRNADIHSGDGLAHAQVDAMGGRLSFLASGHGRTEGIAGPLAAPTLGVRRQLARLLGAASWTREEIGLRGERKSRVQLLASATHQQNRLSDLDQQLGISRRVVSDDVWRRLYARAGASAAALPFLEPTVVVTAARDEYLPEDRVGWNLAPRPSSRSTGALSSELRLHGDVAGMRAELRPSARVQWSRTEVGSALGSAANEEREDIVGTYRAALVLSPSEHLSLSASIASGVRLPSLFELFGDRVFVVPNVGLRPERSRGLDGGVVLRKPRGELQGSVELRVFSLAIDDLIILYPRSQYTLRAENMAEARILGAELGVQGRSGRHLGLALSVTAQDPRDHTGRLLPLRAPLQALVRPQVDFYPAFADRLSLFAEVDFLSFAYLDATNDAFLPGRTVLSAGAALDFLRERMRLEGRARNLLDQPMPDLLSRPLPGFHFLVSLTLFEALG